MNRSTFTKIYANIYAVPQNMGFDIKCLVHFKQCLNFFQGSIDVVVWFWVWCWGSHVSMCVLEVISLVSAVVWIWFIKYCWNSIMNKRVPSSTVHELVKFKMIYTKSVAVLQVLWTVFSHPLMFITHCLHP